MDKGLAEIKIYLTLISFELSNTKLSEIQILILGMDEIPK